MAFLSLSITSINSVFVLKAFSFTEPHIPPTETIRVACHAPPSITTVVRWSVLGPNCHAVAPLFVALDPVHPHSAPMPAWPPTHTHTFSPSSITMPSGRLSQNLCHSSFALCSSPEACTSVSSGVLASSLATVAQRSSLPQILYAWDEKDLIWFEERVQGRNHNYEIERVLPLLIWLCDTLSRRSQKRHMSRRVTCKDAENVCWLVHV